MTISKLSKLKHIVSTFLISGIVAMGIPSTSFADVVSTSQLAEASNVELKRAEVSSFLAREGVKQQLTKLGVSQKNLDQRVSAMTDSEIIQLHEQIDTLPAGEGFLGGILTVLLIFILLDLAGVTDVFPGV